MNKIVLFFTALILSACSALPSAWQNKATALPTLKKDQAGVVFVREKGKVAGPVVNIYLDESYFTSLPEGQYQTVAVCAKNQRISTQFSGVPLKNKYARAQNWKLPAGEWTYLTVVLGEDGQPAFSALDKKDGQAWIKQNQRQNYTLPRQKNLACNTISPTQPSVVEVQAMFQSGQYRYESISPKGREKITQVGQFIAKNPQVRFVNVIGHTDPDGNSKINQTISERRANAIKEGLIRAGVNRNIIKAEGMGDKQPKVRDCAQKYPKDAKARNECNRPNRRVEIQIHGLNP